MKILLLTIFCNVCHECIGLKLTIIRNHIGSAKHSKNKETLKSKELINKNIVDCLQKYLPEAHQVFRVKVVTAFLKASVPLSKLIHFKELLEENNYSLACERGMRDLIPVILKNEEDYVHSIIDGNYLSVIFDGTTRLGEAFAIMIRCVTNGFQIKQLLIKIQMLYLNHCVGKK